MCSSLPAVFGVLTSSYCRIEESVKEDVVFLKSSPFIQPGTRIVGLKYDINSGIVTQVEEATIGN